MGIELTLELVVAIAAGITALVAWRGMANKAAADKAQRDKDDGRRAQWEHSVNEQLASRRADGKEIRETMKAEHAAMRREMQDGFRDLGDRIDDMMHNDRGGRSRRR